jgi:hypothetical protein
MKGERMNYEESLKIDKHNLDEEWLGLPMLYAEWSEKYAQAVLERDREKQRMELVRTELDAKIRSNPDSYGIKKGTEGEIGNCILQQKEYQESQKKHQDSCYQVNVLSGATEALSHKKAALENITKLFLAAYFVRNVVPRETMESVEKAATKAQEASLNKLRRR